MGNPTREEIIEAIKTTPSITDAARMLGFRGGFSSIIRWLDKYGICPEEYKHVQTLNWARQKAKKLLVNSAYRKWEIFVNVFVTGSPRRCYDIKTSELRKIYNEIVGAESTTYN